MFSAKTWAKLRALLTLGSVVVLAAVVTRDLGYVVALKAQIEDLSRAEHATHAVRAYAFQAVPGVREFGTGTALPSRNVLFLLSGHGLESFEIQAHWKQLVDLVPWMPGDSVVWVSSVEPDLQAGSSSLGHIAATVPSLQVLRVVDFDAFAVATGFSEWPATLVARNKEAVLAVGFGVPTPERTRELVSAWVGSVRPGWTNRLFLRPDGRMDNLRSTATDEPEDCITYDPKKLVIRNLGATGWGVAQGGIALLVLDNQDDASAALAIARAYSRLCFVGRASAGEDHGRVVQYWTGPGATVGVQLPRGYKEDCVSYVSQRLHISPQPPRGFGISDGMKLLVVVNSEAESKAALRLAAQHSAHCFVGRQNSRRARAEYIMQYWR